MQDDNGDAVVQMKAEPVDYVLYNAMLQMREFRNLRPSGKPNLGHAMEQVQRLLFEYSSLSGGAVTICVISDGMLPYTTFDEDADKHTQANVSTACGVLNCVKAIANTLHADEVITSINKYLVLI